MAKEKADKANADAEDAKAPESEDEDETNAAAESDAEDSDDDDSDDEDDDESDTDEEVTKADGPDAKKSNSSHPPQAHHGDHDHDDHDDHGLAHTMPIKGLIGVWAALMVFTVLTVSVTHFDLGYRLNLVVAMVIATIKAGLVMMFFMHLWWDKRFNVLVFLGSFLFVALFVGLVLNDRGEYQGDIDAYEDATMQP